MRTAVLEPSSEVYTISAVEAAAVELRKLCWCEERPSGSALKRRWISAQGNALGSTDLFWRAPRGPEESNTQLRPYRAGIVVRYKFSGRCPGRASLAPLPRKIAHLPQP
jgi:hypothetical protein